MGLADVIVTGGAMLPISAQTGRTSRASTASSVRALSRSVGRLIETPIPQDWVGFVRQATLQKSGAPSYLFGEIRETGWRHYYLVTLAVKVPLAFWLILTLRAAPAPPDPVSRTRLGPPGRRGRSSWLIASLGSTRNMGIRYLLPIAPLAIVWISGLAAGNRLGRGALAWARARRPGAGRSRRSILMSCRTSTPWPGGPIGGRHILSDSNLDWGQGLKPLASSSASARSSAT